MEVTLYRERGPVSVTLSALWQGRDGIFWLHGGTAPHIGALCVRSPAWGEQTTVFPGHREEEPVRTLTRQLTETGCLDHMVVCAGIHYDDIPGEWIPQILALCKELGEEMSARLGADGPKEVP